MSGMLDQVWENEDLEERAAILEYDGGLAKDAAESRSTAEIADRAVKKQMPPPDVPDIRPQSKELTALVKQRNDLGEQMRAEKNRESKQQMLEQWTQLNYAIIELKKGV